MTARLRKRGGPFDSLQVEMEAGPKARPRGADAALYRSMIVRVAEDDQLRAKLDRIA